MNKDRVKSWRSTASAHSPIVLLAVFSFAALLFSTPAAHANVYATAIKVNGGFTNAASGAGGGIGKTAVYLDSSGIDVCVSGRRREKQSSKAEDGEQDDGGVCRRSAAPGFHSVFIHSDRKSVG